MSIRKTLSFIRKDFLVDSSYKSAFFMSFVEIISSVLTFFFISKFFRSPAYFPFALIGIAFTSYLYTSLISFSQRLREAQMTGTLEAMLASPTRTKELLIGMGAWDFLFTSIRVLIYILIGALFLDVNLSKANLPAALLVLTLSIMCFSCIGVGAAGLILIFRKAQPLTWVIGAFAGLVSGTYFPLKILPVWIRYFSYVMPLTYSLKAFRGALLYGNSVMDIMPEMLVLCMFIIILFPLGVFIFRKALRKSKIDGSLVHY